jgi:TIR domain
LSAAVFISYSSKDRQIAQTLCQALEARGQNCWIAGRDVRAGENFQESIVRALREARVMVLVFSSNANNSEEIKKEVVLAGRHKVTVVPVRVEDVVPNDAFTYEFATRQWIDLFQDWERQLEQLVNQIDQILGRPADTRPAPEKPPPAPAAKPLNRAKPVAIALASILILAGAGLAVWRLWQHPAPVVAPKSGPPTQVMAQQVPASAPPSVSGPASRPQTAEPAAPVAAAPSTLKSRRVVDKKVAAAASSPSVAATPPPARVASAEPSSTPLVATPPPAPVAQAPADPDEAAWQTASNTASRATYAQYIKEYPAGHHYQEAQLAMANLILNGQATGKSFDGNWQTVFTCPNLGQYPGYSFQLAGQVSDGVFHGVHGVKGQPSSLVLDGKIESDGAAAFFGEIIVGSSLVGLGAARGTASDFHALGTFEGASASGRRIEGRGCTLSFQRQ